MTLEFDFCSNSPISAEVLLYSSKIRSALTVSFPCSSNQAKLPHMNRRCHKFSSVILISTTFSNSWWSLNVEVKLIYQPQTTYYHLIHKDFHYLLDKESDVYLKEHMKLINYNYHRVIPYLVALGHPGN